MNDAALPLAPRAVELRRNFDRSFAEPPRSRQTAALDLLAIRLAGEPYALHLAAVSGLFVDKKLTRLPQAPTEFLGIAGFRGSVVPVYDLRVLLGCVAGAAPRWLIVAAGGPVALAFDGFDGHLRLPQECIARQVRVDAARPHVHELAQVADVPRHIVDLASVLTAIRAAAHQDVPRQRQEQRR